MMIQTGLLLGSFNPIHIGHMALANYLLEFAPFDELWFVVSPQNPFKHKTDLAPAEHRLEMTRLAIQKEPRFKVSNIEFKLPIPSYSINTLKKLAQTYPQNQFSLIIGSDNLLTLDRWHNYSEILDQFQVVVYPRPDYLIEDANTEIIEKVKIVKAPLLDISSTLIRKSLKNKKKLQYLVPDNIYDYLIKHHLYE